MRIIYSIIILFCFGSTCYAQQKHSLAILSKEDNAIQIQEKREQMHQLHEVLKGGIWDDVLPNMVFVPTAAYSTQFSGTDSLNPIMRAGKMTVSKHYILSTEVTNKMYRYFLVEHTDEKYQPKISPSFSVKEKGKTYNATNYIQLDDYPIIGITNDAAMAFCKWITKKMKDALDAANKPELRIKFRLPTETEYEVSAITNEAEGLITYQTFKAAFMDKLFSTTTEFFNYGIGKDSTGKLKRNAMKDGYAFTNPVKKFFAGKLGIFGLQGNVAEWTQDTYDNRVTLFKADTANNGGYKKRQLHKIATTKDGIDGEIEQSMSSPEFKVVKGGSWADTEFYLQPTVRQRMLQNTFSDRVGFRLYASDTER